MADVFVRTERKNTYACKISFKYKKANYTVDYTLTTSVTMSDYVVFEQSAVTGQIDFDRLALRIVKNLAGIQKPSQAILDEVAEALQDALPAKLTWVLA